MLRSRKMRIRSSAHPIVWSKYLEEVRLAFEADRSAVSIKAVATTIVESGRFSIDALIGHVLVIGPEAGYYLGRSGDSAKFIAVYAAAEIRRRSLELQIRESERQIASNYGPLRLFLASTRGGGYTDIFYANLAAAVYLMVQMKSNPDWTLEIRPA